MSQPYGDPGEPTTRFGDPYRAEQPYGGQPAYGDQSPYGSQQPGNQQPGNQQQYSRRYAAANAYGAPIESGAKFGVVGTTLAGIGGVLLIVALTAVNWFSQNGVSLSFSEVHDRVSANSAAASGMASAYFSWLAWTLTIVGLIVAVAANLPSPASGPLRALGAVLAAAAIAFTFLAIRLYTGNSYSDYISHASVGFYLAVVGFLLIGIGALIGPKRY
jgi:hypothetical protein